jgi:tetratricopeptide (TPR) repeat protein
MMQENIKPSIRHSTVSAMLRRLSVVLGGALWFCLAGGTCEAANKPTAMPSSLTQVTTPEVKTAEPKSSKETETLLRAIEESRAALAANPDNAELRFRLAFVLKSHGDSDDAIKEYQAVIVRDPSYVWAHNNLGVMCAKKGLYEEAIGKFGEALFRDPAARDRALQFRSDLLEDRRTRCGRSPVPTGAQGQSQTCGSPRQPGADPG